MVSIPLELKYTDPDAQSMTVAIVSSDFAEPLSVPGSGAKETESVNEEAVGMIISMGFTQAQAIKALKSTVSIILWHCRDVCVDISKGCAHMPRSTGLG